jgi:hypothetical protein
MPDPARISDREELYVGYLPVPPKQRRYLRRAVPVVLWTLCAASFLWARAQHSPGAGVWDDGQPVKLRGVVVTQPYPLIFTQDASGQVQAVLLVEAGKHGSHERFKGLQGHSVTVSGWPLHRDGRRMLELEPTDAAVVADTQPANLIVPSASLSRGTVTLRGEIIDSKCFLGAMKPGEGKTHKECATLCIRGGIPPMLVTRDAQGAATYYLLEDPAGGPIDPAVYQLIADPVEIIAELKTWGGLNVLIVRPESIRRL